MKRQTSRKVITEERQISTVFKGNRRNSYSVFDSNRWVVKWHKHCPDSLLSHVPFVSGREEDYCRRLRYEYHGEDDHGGHTRLSDRESWLLPQQCRQHRATGYPGKPIFEVAFLENFETPESAKAGRSRGMLGLSDVPSQESQRHRMVEWQLVKFRKKSFLNIFKRRSRERGWSNSTQIGALKSPFCVLSNGANHVHQTDGKTKITVFHMDNLVALEIRDEMQPIPRIIITHYLFYQGYRADAKSVKCIVTYILRWWLVVKCEIPQISGTVPTWKICHREASAHESSWKSY